MIGTDEHMVLVITNRGMVIEIIDIGHSTLDSNEMDQLQNVAEVRGYHVYLTEIVEVSDYSSLLTVVKGAVGFSGPTS